MQGHWTCRKCGAVGSVPVHRTECQAHDAGSLAITTPVRAACEFTEQMTATYAAEAAKLGGQVRADLQEAINRLTGLLQMIDAAATGAL